MNKNLFSPIAAAVALLGFFAPWVSCGNMMTWSGIDLASGSSGGGGGMMGDLGAGAGGGDAFGADLTIWGVPLVAIGIIAIYVIFKNKNRLASAMMPTIIVAILGVFVMAMTYIKIQDQKANFAKEMSGAGTGLGENGDAPPPSTGGEFGNMMGGMGIQIEWGFWLTSLAFIGAAVGATKYRDLPKQPEDITTPGTPMEATPPGEVVSSEPPPDASITEDKGMG